MARTIAEIKKEMTDVYMSNSIIRDLYGITGDADFDSVFSPVSIESTLFYIFAATAHVIEQMFDQFKSDVEERIDANIIPTVRWYHSSALAFQYGDPLVYDPEKYQFRYSVIDKTKQLVKYVAVKDRGGSIQILVSGDEGGLPCPLTGDVLTAFKSYMNSIKIAGVILSIQSIPADDIRINATIEVDPMVINASGIRLTDGSKPVLAAINDYLKGIEYGGKFNKTKLVDAIQRVEGVLDIELGECAAKAASATEYNVIKNNNYTAVAGCFILNSLCLNTLSICTCARLSKTESTKFFATAEIRKEFLLLIFCSISKDRINAKRSMCGYNNTCCTTNLRQLLYTHNVC